MSEGIDVAHKIPLSGIAPPQWFAKPDESSFWLRIYTCLFVPHDEFPQAVISMLGEPGEPGLAVRPGGRLVVACGRVNDIKIPFSTFEMTSATSGQLQVRVNVDSKELPDTPYLFLATPFKIDGAPGDEASSRSFLDEVTALICIHAGQNLMRHIVFEGEVEASHTQIHVPGTAMKMPKPAEGPFLSPKNGEGIYEIAAALRALSDDDRRRRLLLSLRLIDHGMRSDFGFLDYWTALEVVCDGRSNRIKAALSKVYGIKSHNDAAEATRLSVIAQWRHEYVHRGLKPILNADVERYLQLLFLDLLRYELGLPDRRYLASIQKARGYDLSKLGIEPCQDGAHT